MLSEGELKAQCWDLIWPVLIFYKETNVITPEGAEALKEAARYYNETETEDRES